MPYWLKQNETPDPKRADHDGLVALGGSLDPQFVLSCYRAGCFPWSSKPVLNWWSPDPRLIFDLASPPQGVAPSEQSNKTRPRQAPRMAQTLDGSSSATPGPQKSLRKSIRKNNWSFAVDRDFAAVIRACANTRDETWITPDIIDAYTELHRLGHAHSFEVYEGDALVGGLYGVTSGGFFGGESMFHTKTDASKAAVWFLRTRLRECGFTLLDAQAPTPHLESLGAIKISRSEYLARLQEALKRSPTSVMPEDD